MPLSRTAIDATYDLLRSLAAADFSVIEDPTTISFLFVIGSNSRALSIRDGKVFYVQIGRG